MQLQLQLQYPFWCFLGSANEDNFGICYIASNLAFLYIYEEAARNIFFLPDKILMHYHFPTSPVY